MAPQIFVDSRPIVKPHAGLFLVEALSGDQDIALVLTRHALFFMQAQIVRAVAEATVAELDNEPIEFRREFPAAKGA